LSESAAWLTVYRDPKHYLDLQLGEQITDLEEAFRLWRFRHVTTVERVNGVKQHRRHQRRELFAQDT